MRSAAIGYCPLKLGREIMDLRVMDHVAINVRDLARSADWYERVLGFRIIHKFTRTWMIGAGAIRLGLFHRPDAQTVDDLDNRVAITHIAFLTDPKGLEAAQIELKAAGVAFDPPDDSGIAHSLFIKDPDGHELEITAYHG
jgi:catechol 2,3-dioxygenase-like lactoylglutathione lyase family enzyme